MQRSENSIRTTHAGRLPPVGDASAHYSSWSPRGAEKTTEDTAVLTRHVADVIRKQVELGIDCVGDGEFWNGRGYTSTTRRTSKASPRAR